ncbi:response regulator [bacterium]|nr:response regulator [bacterium]MBU1637077.1 response regulator [bacterium]
MSKLASSDGKERPRIMAEKRLLVVDDEDVVCQVVEGFLAHSGWAVDSSLTTATALKMHTENPYPVIILDVHMPDDSTDLLRKVKEATPLSQVVMFTGDPSVASARDAVKYGAFDYLMKPLQREELAHEVSLAFDAFNLLTERESLRLENAKYRKQLEERLVVRSDQLRESELKYRAIFDRAADAILLVDLGTGKIADFNISARKLLGAKANEIAEQSIDHFVHGQLAMCLHEAKQDGHKEWRLQRISFRSPDGTSRMAQVSVNKIELEQRNYLQIVARDMTDQIELQQRTELMEMELIGEQRLATIGLLASGVAHNINTPLMGIYGLAQVIKMKHPEIEDIDGVIAQVERINGIIRNLMWKSRQESQQIAQPIDLNLLLSEELKFLEADLEFKHNVEKKIELADNIPPIMGKYSDFSQSVMNICRNSLDAMYNCEKKQMEIRSFMKGDDIIIEVKDSGHGIASEHLDKLFTPFFTTKPPMGRGTEADEPTGTGLGLSTVQKLLSAYGCRFDVNSAPGKGTTFRILIPAKLNAVEESELRDEMS